MSSNRKYEAEYKEEAIKLAKEIGTKNAAEELGIPKGTLSGWVNKSQKGEIDTGTGSRTPKESLNIAQQLQEERKKNKALEKRIKELEEMNEFLEEASAFFAASRQRSAKKRD